MTAQIDSVTLRLLRLQNQCILGAPARTADASGDAVASAVRTLLAIQAQDFSQALWGVGLRAPGAVRNDVLAALAAGRIIRSAPVRGTLHFVAAEDLRWMLRLTAPRTLSGARTRFRELDLDDDTLGRAAQVAAVELAGGGALSRDEFLAVLRAADIVTEGQRGYHIIFALSQSALVCWGPPRATQQALVLVDEWIPDTLAFDRLTALGEFALRYFTGHGPATVRDFAWWSKLTLADARTGLHLARDQLTEFTLADGPQGADGFVAVTGRPAESYWAATSAGTMERARPGKIPSDAHNTEPDAHHTVFALPGFDEYLLGYQDRSLVLDNRDAQRVIPGKNGLFRPILVADGRVIGTWRKGDAAGPTSIIDEPFGALNPRQTDALAHTARTYRAFLAG